MSELSSYSLEGQPIATWAGPGRGEAIASARHERKIRRSFFRSLDRQQQSPGVAIRPHKESRASSFSGDLEDHMSDRYVDIFFYGLFMDRELLEDKNVLPTDVRLAAVPGFALRIGTRAAMVPTANEQVHGALMKLSHADIEKLYSDPSVRAYRPEPVLASLRNGATVAALCYNLPEPPAPDEHNADYATRLRAVAQRIGLPSEYVASIQ